jgi:hypothetical protein
VSAERDGAGPACEGCAMRRNWWSVVSAARSSDSLTYEMARFFRVVSGSSEVRNWRQFQTPGRAAQLTVSISPATFSLPASSPSRALCPCWNADSAFSSFSFIACVRPSRLQASTSVAWTAW